jgi:hypothetical protein
MASKKLHPSGAFIGTLIGLLGSLLVTPPMMLTKTGLVILILGGATIGAGLGAFFEMSVRRGH